MTKRAVCNIVLMVMYLTIPTMGFAHGEFTNDSGKPARILDLNDSQGKPFARLFMTGKKMSIDHYNYPESGAGY